MSDDFLAAMAASSRDRVAVARTALPEAELRARIRDLAPGPRLSLSAQGFDLLAEMKLRSPALGQLRSAAEDDLEQRVVRYAAAGAAAVSVLTEPSRFDGTLDHLCRASRVLATHGVPTMRKDFLVDPYQILEARAAGAGGVLLIIRMLSDSTLAALLEAALEQNLFVLLETFSEQDIAAAVRLLETHGILGQGADRARQGAQVLLGVNCRDLVSLQVVPGRLEQLVDALPRELPRVAESGLIDADDAGRLAAAGYDLALVGSALMSGDHPRDLASRMLAAGRSARRKTPSGVR
ncbi:MAG: indole-3-glycerol phosphate synthase TrpC [Gammaproteobacteria bacterium]